MQAIPMAIMMVGAAVSAAGAIKQGQAASAAAKYNSQVAEQNATASRQAAAVDESRQRQQNYRNLGQMRANAAATGLTMDSFADVFAASAEQGEWDALLIRQEGENRARGYGIESELETARGRSARSAAGTSAAATLLDGAGKSAEAYWRMNPKKESLVGTFGVNAGLKGLTYGAAQGLKRTG